MENKEIFIAGLSVPLRDPFDGLKVRQYIAQVRLNIAFNASKHRTDALGFDGR